MRISACEPETMRKHDEGGGKESKHAGGEVVGDGGEESREKKRGERAGSYIFSLVRNTVEVIGWGHVRTVTDPDQTQAKCGGVMRICPGWHLGLLDSF